MNIGDGLTVVQIGDSEIHIDLVSWVAWYTDRGEQFAENPLSALALVIAKVQDDHKVAINYTQADALLVAVLGRYQEIKKKQLEERT